MGSQLSGNQITIIYDTMWNGTRIMAENIAKGIKLADEKVNVNCSMLPKPTRNNIITEVFKSKAILIAPLLSTKEFCSPLQVYWK